MADDLRKNAPATLDDLRTLADELRGKIMEKEQRLLDSIERLERMELGLRRLELLRGTSTSAPNELPEEARCKFCGERAPVASVQIARLLFQGAPGTKIGDTVFLCGECLEDARFSKDSPGTVLDERFQERRVSGR